MKYTCTVRTLDSKLPPLSPSTVVRVKHFVRFVPLVRSWLSFVNYFCGVDFCHGSRRFTCNSTRGRRRRSRKNRTGRASDFPITSLTFSSFASRSTKTADSPPQNSRKTTRRSRISASREAAPTLSSPWPRATAVAIQTLHIVGWTNRAALLTNPAIGAIAVVRPNLPKPLHPLTLNTRCFISS